MLSTILSLFGKSPFAPLASHMEKVTRCVYLLRDLFTALEKKEYQKIDEIAAQISQFEHEADLTKNDIRNHLPKSLFLSMDRNALLEILAIQDSIADKAEDIAVLSTIKKLELPEYFKTEFYKFLEKNIETFDGARLIIKELHELLESSFGGIEAEKVRTMVDSVSYKEHEADLIQRKLVKALYASEDKMTYATFDLWQKIFETLAAISNLSEKLAHRIRMTLELK